VSRASNHPAIPKRHSHLWASVKSVRGREAAKLARQSGAIRLAKNHQPPWATGAAEQPLCTRVVNPFPWEKAPKQAVVLTKLGSTILIPGPGCRQAWRVALLSKAVDEETIGDSHCIVRGDLQLIRI
jgi:hypothetical protein